MFWYVGGLWLLAKRDCPLKGCGQSRCDVQETRRRLLRACARHCLLWICLLIYCDWYIYIQFCIVVYFSCR